MKTLKKLLEEIKSTFIEPNSDFAHFARRRPEPLQPHKHAVINNFDKLKQKREAEKRERKAKTNRRKSEQDRARRATETHARDDKHKF